MNHATCLDRGPAPLPCDTRVISSRSTRWVWPGCEPTLEVPVTVEVVALEQLGLSGAKISYHVQAWRTDGETPRLIADEPFHGPLALTQALGFARKGWACFEAIADVRAVA